MITNLNLDLLKPLNDKDLDTSSANMEDQLVQEEENSDKPKKKEVKQVTPKKNTTTIKPAPSGAIVVNNNEENITDNTLQPSSVFQESFKYTNNLFNNNTNSTKSKITINKDDYKNYVDTSFVTNINALDKERASKQNNFEQLQNAITRVGLKIGPEIVKQLASVIDVEDYANSDKEVGNAVMRLMTEWQEDADKLTPIYRENPNESFDLGDPAYWLEHGSNLVNSVGAFMATGYMTGGATAALAFKGAKGIKGFIEAKKAYNTLRLANMETGVGRGTAGKLKDIIGGNVKGLTGLVDDTARLSSNTQRDLNAASTVASSIMLNQAEAAGVGVEVFQKAYDLEVLRLKATEESLNMTEEEINEQAKTVAANKATEAINFNRLNIALNLTSAAQFIKPVRGTRALKEMPKRFSDLKTVVFEAGQEGLEENINFIAEKRALADKYNFSDYLNDSFTAEGLEAAALGAIGGAGQQGMMSAFKHLKSYENKKYTEAFSNAYVNYKKQGLTDADATAKAKIDAVAKVGSDKERLSYYESEKQAYDIQQEKINSYKELGNTGKATDFGTAMMNAETVVDLYEEIAIAKKANEFAKVEELQKQLLTVQAEDAFELGTTERLVDLYKAIENLSKNEAKTRFGEDSIKPGEDNYKVKAKKAQEEILALEKLYNESGEYYNSREVYSLNRNKKLYGDALEDIKKKIEDREKEMDYEGTKSYKNNLVQVQEEYDSIRKELLEYEKAQKYFELNDDKRKEDPKHKELVNKAEEAQNKYKGLKDTQTTSRKTDKKLSVMIDTYEEIATKLRETLVTLDKVTDAEYQKDLKAKADARKKKNGIIEKVKTWTKKKAEKEKEKTKAESQSPPPPNPAQNPPNPSTSTGNQNSGTSSNPSTNPPNSQTAENSTSNDEKSDKKKQEEIQKEKELEKKLDQLKDQFIKNGKTEDEAVKLAIESISEDERQILRDSYQRDRDREKKADNQNKENTSTQTTEEKKAKLVEKLFKKNILVPINSDANWGYDGDGRVFIVANINNNKVLFYTSSEGTSGKMQGNWYPVIGISNFGYIIKGSLSAEKDKYNFNKGYGIKEIKEFQDFLNNNLNNIQGKPLEEQKKILGEKYTDSIGWKLNKDIGLLPLTSTNTEKGAKYQVLPSKNTLGLSREEAIDIWLERFKEKEIIQPITEILKALEEQTSEEDTSPILNNDTNTRLTEEERTEIRIRDKVKEANITITPDEWLKENNKELYDYLSEEYNDLIFEDGSIDKGIKSRLKEGDYKVVLDRINGKKDINDGKGIIDNLEDYVKGIEKNINNTINASDKKYFTKIKEEYQKEIDKLKTVTSEINNIIKDENDVENKVFDTADDLDNINNTGGQPNDLNPEENDSIEEDLDPDEKEALEEERKIEEIKSEKHAQLVRKFGNLLNLFQKRGIDTNDFKAVILGFEEIIGRERMLTKYEDLFNKIRRFYNFVKEQDIVTDYYTLMNDSPISQTAKEIRKQLKYYNIEDGLYHDMTDKVSQQETEIYNDLARSRGFVLTENGMAYENYQEEGHNKVAYLARPYRDAFRTKTKDGVTYVLYTHQDTGDDINLEIAEELLDPSLLKEGTTLELKAVDSYTDDNGNVILASTLPLAEKPIALFLNGKQLKGGYLHNSSWITRKNIRENVTDEELSADRDNLEQIKQLVLNSNKPVKIKVARRESGVPIMTAGKIYSKTISEVMPEVQIGIINETEIFLDKNKTLVSERTRFFKNGQIVNLIPINGELVPMPTKRKKLEQDDIESITSALLIYMNAEKSPLYEQIKTTYQLDLHKAQDLKEYLKTFVFLSNNSVKSEDDFDIKLADLDTNIPTINFEGNTIYYSFGQGLGKGIIKKGNKITRRDLDDFAGFLSNSYINFDINNMSNNKKVFHIVDNKVKSFDGTYEHFIKTKLLVNNMGVKLPSGKTIYTIQGTIELNTDTLLGSKKIKRGIGTGLGNKTNYIADELSVRENTQKETEDNIEDDNEESFGFSFEDNNPTEIEQDYNPIEDDVKAKLIADYPFIVGLPELDSFVETVIVDVVDELLLNRDDADYKIDVQSSIKLRIEKISIMLKEQKNKGNLSEEQIGIVSNKIALLKANNDKIKSIIENRLNQRASILKKMDKVLNVTLEDNEDENEENLDTLEEIGVEASIERNIYSDILKYSIDPKTGLTDDLKLFLFKVNEYTVSKKTGKLIRTSNGLGLPNYVSPDEVYNTLVNLIAKSNTNYTPVTYNNILIKLTEASNSKPYLIDVLSKLKKIDDDAKAANKTNNFKNRFTRAFDLTLSHHIYYDKAFSKNKGGNRIIEQRLNNSAQDNVENLLIAKWQQVAKSKDIYQTIDGITSIRPEFIKQFNQTYNVVKENPTYDNLSRWLNSIGIGLSLTAYNTMSNNGVSSSRGGINTLEKSLKEKGGMFYHIHEQINKVSNKSTDEENSTLSKFNLFGDNAFKRLATYLVLFDNSLSNLSHKDTKGNTKYGVIKNKAFTNRFFKLKGKDMDLKYLYNVAFSQDSIWLQNLIIREKNQDGEYVYRLNEGSPFYKVFQYNTAEGIARRGNRKAKSIGDLTEEQMEEYALSLFANQGHQIGGQRVSKVFFPTMSNKENRFTLQAIFNHYKLEEEEIHENDLEELVRTLFYPEFRRILFHQKNKNKINNPEFVAGGDKLFLFPFLDNVEELWDKSPDGTRILKEDAVYPDKLGILSSALRGFLNKLIDDRIETWETNKIITVEGKKQILNIDNRYKVAHKGETIKETAFNFEITNLIANLNIKQVFTGDPATYYKGDAKKDGKVILDKNGKPKFPYYYMTAINEGKRFAMFNGDMNTYSEEITEIVDYLVIADREEESNIIDTYLNTLGLSDKDMNSYREINIADASEFISLKEYLKIKILEGDITQQDADKIQKSYNKTGKVTKKELKVLSNAILNAAKPLYAGTRLDNNVELPLYVKSAAIPLIKEFTKNRKLDKLREYVEKYEKEKNTTLRVAFESAVKLGQPKVIVDIFNENGEVVIPDNIEKSILKNVSRQGHGEQNVVPYDSTSNKVMDGSQQSKQLFLDILDVDGYFHQDLGDEPVTGRVLNKYYNSLYEKLFKLKQQQLIKQIGFDEKTGIISNIKSLQKILLEEAKGLSPNDREFLKLNDAGTDFKYPLFLTSQEKKIASLLNSVVDNRVRKRKFRGKSLVLSTEAGLDRLKDFDTLTAEERGGIIPIGGWNGILNAQREEDGIIKYAEVLVPFKFWDKDNNLLNIKDFMNDDDTIDLSRLPEELLNSFGYRIPTSGLNSMSTIKVVGFLPESMGDVIVAPKDFVTQMGSDFDVDKLYTHMYNTVLTYNEEGKPVLSKVSERHVEERQEIDDNIKTQRLYIQKLKAKDTSVDKIEEEEAILNELLEYAKEYNTLTELTEMLLQNKILSIHESIFSNKDKKVQKKRARPISFGNLPDLADAIFKEDLDYFSPLTHSYQTKKYLSARTGSTATGIFANTVTFNAVLQQVTDVIAFQNKEGRIYHNIAGLYSTSLNNIMTNDGRYKSEVLEAFLSAAVDDEKEQLLSKLNINRQTFDVINAMALQGYNEDLIMVLINQPIIKYLTSNQKRNNKKVVDNILAIATTNVDLGFLASTTYDDLFDLTIDDEMFPDITTMLNDELQKAVLVKFLQFQQQGKVIKDVISAINSDTKGAGKSYFFSIKKTAQILTLPSKNFGLSNISKVIGDYTTLGDEAKRLGIEDEVEVDKILKQKGYIEHDSVYIKPSTINGFASTYATIFNTKLWNKWFPYNDNAIINTFEAILDRQVNKSENINQQADDLREVATAYKAFLYGDITFIKEKYGSMSNARQEIFYDSPTHLSLNSIIADILDKDLYSNPLLKGLILGDPNVSEEMLGRVPQRMKYSNAVLDELAEEKNIASLIRMLVDEKEIGVYNDKMLTSKDLADMLLTYGLLKGGNQSITDMLKYFPPIYIKSLGVYDDVKRNQEKFKTTEVLRKSFMVQYIQHNPALYYDEDLETFIKENSTEEVNRLIYKGEQPPAFVILKGDAIDGYFIYMGSYSNPRILTRIDNLGNNSITEYTFEPKIGKSLTYVNQADDVVVEDNNEQSNRVKPIVKDLDKWSELKNVTQAYTDKGIVVTRISNTTEHFGNPFIGSKRRDRNGNIIEAKVNNITTFNTIAEADQAYRDWLTGVKHQNIEPIRRDWILNEIRQGNLDNKVLLYYKPMEVINNNGTIIKGGYHSHADTLAEIVEEIRNNTPDTIETSVDNNVGNKVDNNVVNSGNYNSNDVVFVSIGGKRPSNNLELRKTQQDKTIKEALKAIEQGATLITDNKAYVEHSDYNEGEKRLAKIFKIKGYNYSEETVDNQILGVWTKSLINNINNFSKKNIFTVIPLQSADKKAIIKASISNKFIGFGEGIKNSSTESYRQQILKQTTIKSNDNQQLTLFDNNPIEFTLFEEYNKILKEKGVTEEVFNQLLKEFGEDYVIEYINKCK